MKASCLATLLVIGLAGFSLATQLYAQEHDHSAHSMEADKAQGGDDHSADVSAGHSMESDQKKSSSDKARCAYDGMMMKKSAMVPMEHGEETLYFCSEEQKAIFEKDPKRYLKKLPIGHHHVLMNMLTMKEYMDMMEGMGMGKMAKKAGHDDTHWVGAYAIVGGHSVEVAGMTVKIVSPGGKTTLKELEYDKMMKTYTGNLSLSESGEYKLSVLLESAAVLVPQQ